MSKIIVPEIGESITEGVISAWIKQDGEQVKSGEPIYELETDKITTEVPAESSGTLKIEVAAGTTVAIGAQIGVLQPSKATPSTEPSTTPAPKPTANEVATEPVAAKRPDATRSSATGSEKVLSPSVRRLLNELQLKPEEIPATGKGGRLLKEDVLRFLAGSKDAPSGATMAKSQPAGRVTRERMSTLRQRIAQRLVASQHERATLTTFNEADMSAVLELRRNSQEQFQQQHGVKLGFMSFFVKACVAALKAVPEVNAQIDGEEIVYHHYYDIGIAVSTDKGLVVPVLRNAEQLSLAEMELGIHDLAQRARENRLALQELQGGTFTISNGGVFGSLLSTPIINPPQTGILGMHTIQKRSVVIDDQLVIRPMMYLAFSYDHRLIDGREAVTFLRTIKEHIETPGKFLLELN